LTIQLSLQDGWLEVGVEDGGEGVDPGGLEEAKEEGVERLHEKAFKKMVSP
jgi:hypothetical protein